MNNAKCGITDAEMAEFLKQLWATPLPRVRDKKTGAKLAIGFDDPEPDDINDGTEYNECLGVP